MRNVSPNREIGNLCVVPVRVVNGVVFAFAHIGGKGFTVVRLGGVVGLAVAPDKRLDEGVGAGGVIGRVGQGQDVFILAQREAFNLMKFRVLQLLAQLPGEVGAAGFVVLKGQPQTLDRALLGGGFCKKRGLFGLGHRFIHRLRSADYAD